MPKSPPLHGVPLGVKDLFWTKGVPTAGGTMVHRDFVPNEDATVVARLKQASAMLLGKLEMTEGAYSDHHPAIAPQKNPWHAAFWTGISSSRPAVAMASGLCYGALASDTGGSIRWPCGATGLSGIKPSWGRVSRFGVFELAASLDHVGAIARSVTGRHPTTPAEPCSDYIGAVSHGVCGLRLPALEHPRGSSVAARNDLAQTASSRLGGVLVAGAVHKTFDTCAVGRLTHRGEYVGDSAGARSRR